MTSFDIVFSVPTPSLQPNEGLIVLLADLIKGLNLRGVKTRIFVPKRLKNSLNNVLEKNELAADQYVIVPIPCTPISLSLYYRWMLTKRAKRHGHSAIAAGVLAFIRRRRSSKPSAPKEAVGSPSARTLIIGSASLAALVPIIGRILIANEARRMARVINRRTDVSAVFCPFTFCGDLLSYVAAPKLTVFPDCVTLEFPTRYIGQQSQMLLGQMQTSVEHSNALVCYSKSTADHQLRKHFGAQLNGKPVHVIPQGFFEVSAQKAGANFSTIKFKNFFPDLCPVTPDYRVEDINYVVYPSVDRPHKNMVTLIRAIEHLVRRNQCDIKVVSTSHVIGPDTRREIENKAFFLDCLFAPSLSEPDLNYLVEHAALVVHPSLEEGGDIFNFSRGVSVGVPALMADIPVVREMFDRYGISPAIYGKWLFEPRDHVGLAKLILQSLEDRPRLILEQMAVLKTLQKYNFAAMAALYFDAYTNLADAGRTERHSA